MYTKMSTEEYYLDIEAAAHVAATAFVVASVIVGDIILVRSLPADVPRTTADTSHAIDLSHLGCVGSEVPHDHLPDALHHGLCRYVSAKTDPACRVLIRLLSCWDQCSSAFRYFCAWGEHLRAASSAPHHHYRFVNPDVSSGSLR